ncbi:MAG: xylose isomerase [Clostridiales bacterium]|nr:xylose isomerase [Clostridiales bacterium]
MADLFKNVPVIKYEGAGSDNPFAFKYYNPDEMIDGKPMRDHLRFAMAYWHTLVALGADQFGVGTMDRPWNALSNPMDVAKMRVEAAFEIMNKLSIDYFCFHDRDVAPEADTLSETNKNLDVIVELLKQGMKDNNKKLLWGTASLFGNKRYMHGGATSCNADVFAFAAAQVKKAMEVTNYLGGEGYVFWGGREGYDTLLNTDMGLELDNLARFFHMAIDYADEIGFKVPFYIEPKPKEPTKHQYDFDTATVCAFLQKYNLMDRFKMNIETNHATLATHDVQHELRVARINGLFGSVDANQGDMLIGWDTDQFPTDIYTTTKVMYEVIMAGGFTTGGLNFDAKPRRASSDTDDIFIAHIAGIDAFAKGFKIARRLIEDGVFENFIADRYSSYTTGIGKDIVEGKVGFKELEAYTLKMGEVTTNKSGRQEYLETLLNKYMFE